MRNGTQAIVLIGALAVAACGPAPSPSAPSPLSPSPSSASGSGSAVLCSDVAAVHELRAALANAFSLAFDGRLSQADAAASKIIATLKALPVPDQDSQELRDRLSAEKVWLTQPTSYLLILDPTTNDPAKMRADILDGGQKAVAVADGVFAQADLALRHACPRISLNVPKITFPGS